MCELILLLYNIINDKIKILQRHPPKYLLTPKLFDHCFRGGQHKI